MNEQDIYPNYPYFLYATDTLSSIKDQFFRQKRQAIDFTEKMIQSKDLSYIPKILSCFLIEDQYLHQLDADRKQFIQLQDFDADMRRLYIICKILMEEKDEPGGNLFFLEQVDTFDDLIQKYIRIELFLHRLEFSLPEKALQEAADMLTSDQVSICALSKVIDYEIFADKENIYNEILKMKLAGEILK